jgi:hypothetical protein
MTLGGCAAGVSSPIPVSTAVASRRQDPSPSGLGVPAIPSLDVCLSAFSTAGETQSMLQQISAQLGTAAGPSYEPSASASSRVTVPGVPGAVASFLDLSTFGQGSAYFAKGKYPAYAVTICKGSGGAVMQPGSGRSARTVRRASRLSHMRLGSGYPVPPVRWGTMRAVQAPGACNRGHRTPLVSEEPPMSTQSVPG